VTDTPPRFDAAFAEQFDALLRWRRDVRHFKADPLPDGCLERLVGAANLAPSVGLSQPWRFVRVSDPARRQAVIDNFERCNADALNSYGEDRAALYARLKLAGLKEAPEHLAVFADPEPAQGAGLGRATMPETVGYSVAIAVHTLWLAARIEEIGVGWVSILDADAIGPVLEVDPAWRLVAYLCVGYPSGTSDAPELERKRWEHRQAARLLQR